MTTFTKKLKVNLIAAIVLLVAFKGIAQVKSVSNLKLDASQVAWTRLLFNSKNFWVEVSTDIQLISLPAAEIEGLLLSSPKGTPIKLAKPQDFQMTINTVIDPRFRPPVDIYNRVWFSPTDSSALGRIRLRRGEDDFKKIYRFTEKGVFRHRMEPKDKGEARLEPEKWTDIKDSFYAYDLIRLGCHAVIERSVLIYIISAASDLKNNDTLSLCVFGKRQLHLITLQHVGVFPIKVDYIEKREQGEIRKQEIVKAIKITLSSEPMESDLKTAENFSFLGFHKNIVIHIDPTSGIPLQVSGNIPTAGKAVLKLHKFWLKN